MIPFCFTCFTCYTYGRRQYPSIIIKNSFRFVSSNCNICNNCNRTILKKLTFLLSVPKYPALSHHPESYRSTSQHDRGLVFGTSRNINFLGNIYKRFFAFCPIQKRSVLVTVLRIKKVDDSELSSGEICIASLIGSERIQVLKVEHPRGLIAF